MAHPVEAMLPVIDRMPHSVEGVLHRIEQMRHPIERRRRTVDGMAHPIDEMLHPIDAMRHRIGLFRRARARERLDRGYYWNCLAMFSRGGGRSIRGAATGAAYASRAFEIL